MFPPSNTVSPGTLLTTVGQIGLDDAFPSTVDGKTLVANSWTIIDLSLNVLGSITLPANPSGFVFSTCAPASVPNLNFGEGQTAGGNFIQFNLNTPTTGTFCTTWDFSNGQYTFVEGTFTATTVPEPSSLALLGSGLIALLGAHQKKRTAHRSKNCLLA